MHITYTHIYSYVDMYCDCQMLHAESVKYHSSSGPKHQHWMLHVKPFECQCHVALQYTYICTHDYIYICLSVSPMNTATLAANANSKRNTLTIYCYCVSCVWFTRAGVYWYWRVATSIWQIVNWYLSNVSALFKSVQDKHSMMDIEYQVAWYMD